MDTVEKKKVTGKTEETLKAWNRIDAEYYCSTGSEGFNGIAAEKKNRTEPKEGRSGAEKTAAGRSAALILAAGRSSRMQAEIPKQFLLYRGRPLFLWSVEKYRRITDLTVVVTGEADVEKTKNCLASFGMDDVPVITGGEERYDSSFRGLLYLEEKGGLDTVMIHDAARAFVMEEIIGNALESARNQGTAVAAVPLKDTVKRADEKGLVLDTPDRSSLYLIQTPQAFSLKLILACYRRFFAEKEKHPALSVTDDASVVEQFSDHPVQLTPGSYDNIKITTPDDLKWLRE